MCACVCVCIGLLTFILFVLSISHVNTEILFGLLSSPIPFALQWKVNMSFSAYPFELCFDASKLIYLCVQIQTSGICVYVS